MKLTLSQVLERVGGYTEQDTTLPTGTELTTRINYANRALDEWANMYDWNELTKRAGLNVSYASGVSIPLPANFKKPMSGVYYYDSTTPREFTIIDKDDYYMSESGTDICYIDGNPVDGFHLIVPQGLPSGASLVMDYQMHPSSLATTTDTIPMANPEFVTNRVIAYVLEARADSRFPYMKAEANKDLNNMLEAQHAKNLGMENKVKTRSTFRIGR